jgi:hypothetical protein
MNRHCEVVLLALFVLLGVLCVISFLVFCYIHIRYDDVVAKSQPTDDGQETPMQPRSSNHDLGTICLSLFVLTLVFDVAIALTL